MGYKIYIILLLCISIILSVEITGDSLREKLADKQNEILERDEEFDTYVLGISSPKVDPDFLLHERDVVIKSTSIWLKSNLINREDILNYVLPYRINNAHDLSWRNKVREDLPIKEINKVYAKDEFIDFCDIINDSIRNKIVFDLRMEDENFMSYTKLQKVRKGSCAAMTDFTNYTFRAFGIPVTTDFVPTWGNLNSASHSWNVLLLKDQNIPFMGTESYIRQYNPLQLSKCSVCQQVTYRIPPKVYRKSKYHKESFFFLKEKVIDVTDEYVDVQDIRIHNRDHLPELYLATFNNGKFIINSKGTPHEDDFSFSKMAKGLVYFPVSIKNNKIYPVDYPIVCGKNYYNVANPNWETPIDVKVDFLESLEEAQFKHIKKHGYGMKDDMTFYSNKIRVAPTDGKEYELYYWNRDWVLVKRATCINQKLLFKGVPSSALYLIKSNTQDFSEKRFFTYSNDSLYWF